MSTIDWAILILSLVFIVSYGVWKGRGSKDIKGYIMADRNIRWYIVALSVMATQASAITFLSTPGQAYSDGMRFVQFYFGLPIAMVILCIVAIPIYHKLNVFTAYEYLEKRFDLKTRGLAAILFLIQRGLAAGLTIYAPSIIISTLLGLNIYFTNLVIGVLVIIYTASGGSKAVSWTQTQQMIIIMTAMVGAFFMVIYLLPKDVSFTDALFVAGKMGKLNAIDFSFDLSNRYNIWSGVIGGLFLALSYFGTDQSQVQRYLTAKSITHSRMGLLTNGLVKVPMQFFILLIGAMVFVFYQFTAPPLFFNTVESQGVRDGQWGKEYRLVEAQYQKASEEKVQLVQQLVQARQQGDKVLLESVDEKLQLAENKVSQLKEQGVQIIKKHSANEDVSDTNYIFLSFVLKYMPVGLLGLIIAAIIAAAMSSTSSELNALASTTVVDIYKRMMKKTGSDRHYLRSSKLLTVVWGILAILFAQYANRLGTLVEAVNILGSLFYGTILGIFMVAFFLKFVRGAAAFYAAIFAEAGVVFCFLFTDITYLWYNVVGCLLVIIFSIPINHFLQRRQ
ncbi:MAG: sodium:solute symporter [Candidatus Aminicenantes bacterium]|jgi:Na+/proline symporter